MNCQKCNAEMPDEMKFCPQCGEKQQPDSIPPFVPMRPVVICMECGEQNDAKYEFCQSCGAKLGLDTERLEEQQKPCINQSFAEKDKKSGIKKPASKKEAKPTKNGIKKQGTLAEKIKTIKIGKKQLIAGGVIAAAVIVLLAVILAGSKKKSGTDYVLFVREENVSIASLKEKKLALRTLTDNFGKAEAGSGAVTLSQDGKGLLFIDDAGEGSDCALYYLDISGGVSNGLPVRICSGIRSPEDYKPVNGGKKVLFIRSDGALCVSDLKSVTELCASVTDFWADENGDYIIYTAGDDSSAELCEIMLKTNVSQTIDRGVTHVRTTDTLGCVFYLKDGSLYKRVKGGERERIAAGVKAEDITEMTPSGNFYYVITDTVTANISDMVNDDKAQSDSLMEEPQPPSYPRTADYKLTTGTTDWDKYHAAVAKYEELMERYEKDYAEYELKLRRDALREEMKGKTAQYEKTAMYYYNGAESVSVNEAGCTPISEITKDGTLAYVRPAENSITKVNIAELESLDDVQLMLNELGGNDGRLYIARAGVENDSGVKAEGECDITKDGRAVWLGSSGIWSMKLDGEEFEAKLLLDGGKKWYEAENGKLLLFKKTSGSYEMYDESGKLVDENVRFEDIVSSGENIYYLTDCSSRTQSGTLMRLNGSKTSEIENDVYAFALTRNGSVAYLVNYSLSNMRGELAIWIKNQKTAVDEKVSAIVPLG